MTSQDMQVLGILRFSYPALGGFQIQHESLEERRAFLYAPERIEERLRSFEAIALPGLKAQTDPNFKLLIVTGECLPEPYKSRLHDLVSDFPQAEIVAWPSERHRPAMSRIINTYRDQDAKVPCIQFRHDDDDAVSVNFIKSLREAVDDCAPLIAKNRFVGIDFNRGYSARAGADGLSVTPSVLQYYGVALALVTAPGVAKTIMNFAHHKMNQFMPTATFTEQEMFIRGHGDFNDSQKRSNVDTLKFQPLDAEGETLFKELFAIDSDRLREIYKDA